jgi:transmembrane 9 superfamily protein 2/4
MDYYGLPFCVPDGGIKLDNMNLGEFLEGDRIESSPYILRMKEEMYCQQLCVSNLGPGEAPEITPNKVVKAIRNEYRHNWIVDNLPAASKVETDYTITTRYWQGFPVGFIAEDSGLAYVHNHVNIEIRYHSVDYDPGKYQIVRFTVEPFSIKHDFEYTNDEIAINKPIHSCNPKLPTGERIHTSYEMINMHDMDKGAPYVGPQPASGKVLFTYDVTWVQSDDVDWASRWDIYLDMDNAVPARVYWGPIVLGIIIILILSGIIVCIVAISNLGAGSTYYRVSTTDEQVTEEKGWKAVHGDVFRPPSFSPFFLCVACGTGAQLLGTAFCIILLSIFGPLSEANRGSLLTSTLMLYALMGVVSGYFSALLDNTLQAQGGARLLLYTALGFPGLWFCVFIVNDLVALSNQSTDAVPLATTLVLLFLWLAVSTPLVFLGARFGYNRQTMQFPVESSSSIPRPIPNQPCFLRTPVLLILGGILPFCICFSEFYFILASAWLGYYYDNFGSLLVVSFISIVISAEIMVLFHYFSLKRENYRWWWRSFVTAGSPAVYACLWSFFFFGPQLSTDSFTAFFKYYTYMGLFILGYFLMTGCTGVAFCLCFNKMLYRKMRYDVDAADAHIELLPREVS